MFVRPSLNRLSIPLLVEINFSRAYLRALQLSGRTLSVWTASVYGWVFLLVIFIILPLKYFYSTCTYIQTQYLLYFFQSNDTYDYKSRFIFVRDSWVEFDGESRKSGSSLPLSERLWMSSLPLSWSAQSTLTIRQTSLVRISSDGFAYVVSYSVECKNSSPALHKCILS